PSAGGRPRPRREVALAISEAHGQLARRQRRLPDRHLEDALAHVIGDAVPDAVRPRRAIAQRLRPAATVSVVPAVKGCPRNAELGQGTAHRQRRLFDQPDDLQLLGSGVSHAPSSPAPIVLFLSSRFSSRSSATASFKAPASRRRSLTSSELAARAVSPARRFLPASR